ncbi:MAG TPA: T9SS type A sorting domain-containing protein [Candidatus Acidoferrum sp.]|nr:T9SS type A sorting domain-containing protein [Candidatus Acidoferrum sp.]
MKTALIAILLLIGCAVTFAQSERGLTSGPVDSVRFEQAAGKPSWVLRGDLNHNGLAYEIADAVMYTRYFIFGDKAFAPHVEEARAAADINGDHIGPSVADLVCLIRTIIGDADPRLPRTPVRIRYDFDQGILSVSEPVGAVYVVFSGNVTPTNNSDLEMMTGFDGLNTRCLLYPNFNHATSTAYAEYDILACNAPIVSIEMVSPTGRRVSLYHPQIDIGLDQNYPNPFNSETWLSFNLPDAARWQLSIYDILGREVASWDGVGDPGVNQIKWNAAGQPTGVYFCRLTAHDTYMTRKMILLK